MTRDEVIERAKQIKWIAKPCADPGLIAVRAYKSDINERMRIGSNGEMYTQGDDGWMYQIGTVEDVANAVIAKTGAA